MSRLLPRILGAPPSRVKAGEPLEVIGYLGENFCALRTVIEYGKFGP
jgi:hypothetical protein